MKKTLIKTVSFIIAVLLPAFSVTANADRESSDMFFGGGQTYGGTALLKDMLVDLIDTDSVTESYRDNHLYSAAEDIRVDPNVFYVVYKAETQYFAELFSNESTLDIDSEEYGKTPFCYPTVKVPVFADVGNMEGRVIGCVNVEYNYGKNAYEYSCVSFGLPQKFAEGADIELSYLEDIADEDSLQNECARLGVGAVEDAWLIELTFRRDFYNKILVVVQTADGIYVIDYFNTVQAVEYGYDRDKAKVYTADDYFAKRLEYEAQQRYNTAKNNAYGISEVSKMFMDSGIPKMFEAVMYGSIIVIGTACLIGVFALARYACNKKKKCKGDRPDEK